MIRMMHGRAWLMGVLFAGAACVGDRSTTGLTQAPETVLGRMTMTPRVSLLAVGGTQQLSVTAQSLAGTPFTAVDSTLYTLSSLADTARVRLTPQGLLTGLSPSSGAIVVTVFAFAGGNVRWDMGVAQVTATALQGLSLSIQPTGADSAKLAKGSLKTIVPVLRNATTGQSIANPAMLYRTREADEPKVRTYYPTAVQYGELRLRPSLVAIPAPVISAPNQIGALVGEGSAWIQASVNAYGTLLQDSVQYTFSYPYTLTVSSTKTNLAITSVFKGQVMPLAPGATVTFTNGAATTDLFALTYTFDTPTAATAATTPSTIGGASGNITVLAGGQSSNRRFLTPGSYRWTATGVAGPAPWNGQSISGTIIIK